MKKSRKRFPIMSNEYFRRHVEYGGFLLRASNTESMTCIKCGNLVLDIGGSEKVVVLMPEFHFGFVMNV